jgi:hypothetical protein
MAAPGHWRGSAKPAARRRDDTRRANGRTTQPSAFVATRATRAWPSTTTRWRGRANTVAATSARCSTRREARCGGHTTSPIPASRPDTAPARHDTQQKTRRPAPSSRSPRRGLTTGRPAGHVRAMLNTEQPAPWPQREMLPSARSSCALLCSPLVDLPIQRGHDACRFLVERQSKAGATPHAATSSRTGRRSRSGGKASRASRCGEPTGARVGSSPHWAGATRGVAGPGRPGRHAGLIGDRSAPSRPRAAIRDGSPRKPGQRAAGGHFSTRTRRARAEAATERTGQSPGKVMGN